MKRLEKAICLAMIFTVLFSFTGFAAQCEDIPEHVLRLHVLANSDSKEDQTLKLQVRDRILQESAGMLDDVQNKEDAEQCIREKLPELQRAAADEIAAHGYDYPVQWNWNAPISQQENMNRLHCQRECMRLYGFVSGTQKGIIGGV